MREVGHGTAHQIIESNIRDVLVIIWPPAHVRRGIFCEHWRSIQSTYSLYAFLQSRVNDNMFCVIEMLFRSVRLKYAY